MRTKTMIIILAAITLIRSVSLSLIQHEMAHASFHKNAGQQVEYGISLTSAYVQPMEQPTKDLTNLELADAYNESIAYNLSPLLGGILCLQFLAFVCKIRGSE
jgi:hypothetical protein